MAHVMKQPWLVEAPAPILKMFQFREYFLRLLPTSLVQVSLSMPEVSNKVAALNPTPVFADFPASSVAFAGHGYKVRVRARGR